MYFSLCVKNRVKKQLIKGFRKIIAEIIKEKSPPVETERPLTIACHMKKILTKPWRKHATSNRSHCLITEFTQIIFANRALFLLSCISRHLSCICAHF
jgi:hypothetical protein